MTPETVPTSWLVLGFLGQALFFSRFVAQWVASERRKASIVPTVFWWLSLAGGLSLLVYATLRQDIVIMAGQAAGLLVYGRNLVLRSRERNATAG